MSCRTKHEHRTCAYSGKGTSVSKVNEVRNWFAESFNLRFFNTVLEVTWIYLENSWEIPGWGNWMQNFNEFQVYISHISWSHGNTLLMLWWSGGFGKHRGWRLNWGRSSKEEKVTRPRNVGRSWSWKLLRVQSESKVSPKYVQIDVWWKLSQHQRSWKYMKLWQSSDCGNFARWYKSDNIIQYQHSCPSKLTSPKPAGDVQAEAWGSRGSPSAATGTEGSSAVVLCHVICATWRGWKTLKNTEQHLTWDDVGRVCKWLRHIHQAIIYDIHGLPPNHPADHPLPIGSMVLVYMLTFGVFLW